MYVAITSPYPWERVVTPTSVINETSTSLYSYTLWQQIKSCKLQENIQYEEVRFTSKLWGNKPKKCEAYVQAKITRKPFPNVTRSTSLLDLIHSDTCNFKSFVTRGGMKYFIIFIDDHSRFCHVYLLKSKDEALSKFIKFRTGEAT